MAEAGTLHDAFIDELRDTYDAERQLTKALPKLAKAATAAALREAFEIAPRGNAGADRAARAGVREPRREGPRQALRRDCRHHRRRQVDHGRGLRRGDDGRLPDCRRPARRTLRDGGLRHLVAWARAMGHDEAADLLQENLDEEKAADEKLSDLAEGGINQSAVDAAHPDEEPAAAGASGARKRFREGESRAPLNENRAGQVLRPHR